MRGAKTEDQSSFIFTLSTVNEVIVDNVEQIAQLNIQSASYFNAMGIKQLRAVADIKDMDSLKQFASGTLVRGGDAARRIMDDGAKMMAVGTETKDRLATVFSKTKGGSGTTSSKQ